MYPQKHDISNGLERAIIDYRATGRVVHVYPRKYMISLNGQRPIPYAVAYRQMVDLLTQSTN